MRGGVDGKRILWFTGLVSERQNNGKASRESGGRRRAMKQQYTVVVGEVGNEIGHTSTHLCGSDALAVRAARRQAAGYGRDGWWTVCDDTGRPVSKGGRRSL